MRSKGLVLSFMILLTLACTYQFCLTIPTSNVENKAMGIAKERMANSPKDTDGRLLSEREVYGKVLDSLSTDTIFTLPLIKSYTYSDLKKSQLALGLDLKGGMSVLLQVDLKDFLKTLSGNNESEAFLKALDEAEANQKKEQSDFISLFVQAYEKQPNAGKLANLFFRSAALDGQLDAESSNDLVREVLRKAADQTVGETFNRLKERIDKLGVVQPNVALDAARDLILVELPGIDNPKRAREMLEKAAVLEFWNTYRPIDRFGEKAIVELLQEADLILKARAANDTTLLEASPTRKDTQYVYATDSLGNVDSTQREMKVVDVPNEQFSEAGPLLSKLTIFQPTERGASFAFVDRSARDNVLQWLEGDAEIKKLFPKDLKWAFSSKPATGEQVNGKYSLYALKIPRDGIAPMDGAVVTKASAQPDPRTGEVQVSLQMNNDGARTWASLTTEAAKNQNREIAITLDKEVVSAPSVNEPITGGSSSISGSFSLDEASYLSNILEVGKLPAKPYIVQESQVGPSLGQDNINKSLTTMILSVTLLCLFMWIWYAGGGLVSVIALLLNVFFLIGTLASMGTVLTLPGIAGIVLTLSAAVDANVIIYERIREEISAGLSTLKGIKIGFARALPAILDANLTTFVTAAVLMYFGLGPIKGFGTVLLVGILTSLFTAVLVARMLTDWWTDKGREIGYDRPFSKDFLATLNIDWMGKRKMAYMISGTLLAISLGAFVTRGFELGVDFKGGFSYNVKFDKPVEIGQLREAFSTSFAGASTIVKSVSSDNVYNITTSYMVDETGEGVQEKVLTKLHEGVSKVTGNIPLETFRNTAETTGTHILSSAQVGATIADDIRDSSFKAGIIALIFIFLYLLFRFRKWQFSMGAVGALLHDVLITLGFFALLHGLVPFSLEIDQAIIACILTVIGFSVNDTVIVYDRIREYMGLFPGAPKEFVVNKAVNTTMSRTLITSGTTIAVALLLFIFGGSATKGFAFGMTIGLLIGTYSSIFVASALVVDTIREKTLNERSSETKKGKGAKKNESAHAQQMLREAAEMQ